MPMPRPPVGGMPRARCSRVQRARYAAASCLRLWPGVRSSTSAKKRGQSLSARGEHVRRGRSKMADTLQFELDINDTGTPTAEQVLEYRCPTAGYMCPLTANTYGLDFLSFRIRDYATSKQLFEVARDPDAPPVDISQIPPEMEDQVRPPRPR